MKTTEKISISGFAFNINEDAYRVLKAYMDRLAAHFSKREDGKEIMEDIEARIAELVMSEMKSQDEVITLQQIEGVIGIVGKPEELTEKKEDEMENQRNTVGSGSGDGGLRHRRLYRDPDNRRIAGVCGGIAAYLNIDPTLVRILALLLVLVGSITPFISGGGIVIITYLILWIAVPRATTIAQKLEMRGESPTAANIERRIKDEPYRKSDSALGGILRFFLIAIGALVLLPLAIAILAIIFAVVGSLFAGGWVINTSLFSLASFVDVSSLNLTLLKILTIAIVCIPVLLIFYGILRLLFRFRTKVRGLVGISLTVWILCIIGIGFVGVSSLVGFRRVATATRVEQVSIPAHSLRIGLPNNFADANEELTITTGIGPDAQVFIPFIWQNEESKTLFVLPGVKVRYSDSATDISIRQESRTRGKSRSEAFDRAKQLPAYYSVADSTLTVMPIAYTKDSRWRGDMVRLIVTVPKSMNVSVDPALQYKKRYWEIDNGRYSRHWRIDVDDDSWDE